MKKLYHISDAVTAEAVASMKAAAICQTDYVTRTPFVISEKVTDKIRYCQQLSADEIAAAGSTGMREKDGILINRHNLFFSNNYGGKMKGIAGLSGFAGNNALCIKRAQDPNSICSKCFSFCGSKFSNLKAWTKNDVILSTVAFQPGDVILDPMLIPEMRYSTHGDLINALHAYNLMIQAADNPQTQFTLWTKNAEYYRGGLEMYNALCGPKPRNLRVIWSASRLDVLPTASGLKALKAAGFDAYFAVYSRRAIQDKAVNSFGGHFCKCGPYSCKKHCHFCYDYYNAERWSNYSGSAALIAEILNGADHKE